MTETAAIVRPKINFGRKEVAAPTNHRTGPDFLDFEDYGVYTLSLRHLQYRVGERSGQPFYLACVSVLASNNTKWPIGREMGIYFSTGRMGDNADRDDIRLGEFVRAVAKLSPAPAEVDVGAELDKAINMGKAEHDQLKFRLIRGHDKPKEVPVLANGKPTFNADGQPAVEIKQWTRDKFEIA